MDQEETTSGAVKWTGADQALDLYSDAAGISLTSYSIVLELGRSMPGIEPGQLIARLRLSPQHAKVVAMILAIGVQRYEQLVGQSIAVPPEVLARFSAELGDGDGTKEERPPEEDGDEKDEHNPG